MPHVRYEHVDITAQCHLGRQFQIYQQSNANDLKLCDGCGKAIQRAKNPTVNPLLQAAKTYGPGNIPLPPPMQHPTPGNPLPKLPMPGEGGGNPGPLTG